MVSQEFRQQALRSQPQKVVRAFRSPIQSPTVYMRITSLVGKRVITQQQM